MTQLDSRTPRLTFDAFVAWERHQETKHEFIDGTPVAMAGGTEAHTVIQRNLLVATVPRLRGEPCRPFTSDMLVKTGTGCGRYPDMTIDCGAHNPANVVAPMPVAVFEVLSPDTQREDRTIKLSDYNGTPSIAHYVLVEPSQPLVHIYSRGPHGDFLLRPHEIRGLDGTLALPSVALSLPMADVYEGLDFNTQPGDALILL